MSIKTYIENGRKFYEVFVKGRDIHGRQVGKRKRGIVSGNRATKIEFEYKKKIEALGDMNLKWTWKAWHQECLRRMKLSLKVQTVENYGFSVNKWIPKEWHDRGLYSFNKADVHTLLFETIVDTATPHLRKELLRRLKRIFEMAVEDGIISKNPTKGLRVDVSEAEQKVLNANEVEILLNEAHKINHRFYPVWVMALKTGMRSGELYALRWSDIDFETELISVKNQWTSKDGLHGTKSGRNRLVPISPDLKVFLIQLKLQGGHTETLWSSVKKADLTITDLVLPRLREWKIGDQAFVLKGFCDAIGITEVKFHDLRATFITNLLAQGESLVTVMSIVGHSRMSTTDRYVRLAGIGVKGSTKKLSYSIPTDNIAAVVKLYAQSQ